MSDQRCSVALENGRYAKVTLWQNEVRLDMREYIVGEKKIIPTKKGISLKLHHIKTLSNFMDSIQDTLKKNGEMKWHLGYNVYVSVKEDNPCVDIRQYWKPPQTDESVPTKKGLCLRPQEYDHFLSQWETILNSIPELETFVPCYDQDDHLNQLGML
ncbi:uncharacterized protein LOC133198229 [Saccostrea echinata]|uniref:uncharacterized protein LOC133198229 n=1 Tax=Saccostrea echinata TaxID=191078 RepID=UPI002A81819B|nr:uncharacterized protein LOC133198229 [Saccostrea echinata]